MARSDYTWMGSIDLNPITFTGAQEQVSDWAKNLIGQDIKVVGKDGTEHVIGIVTSYLTKAIL